MSEYIDFARFYDRLMYDCDYDQRADYIISLFNRFACKPKLMLDLACGTGNFTYRMARLGVDLIGVEEHLEHYLNKIAERMVLAVIEEKMNDKDLSEDDKLFTAQTCAYVVVGILVSWVSRGMKEAPEIMIKKTGRLLDGMIEKTLSE